MLIKKGIKNKEELYTVQIGCMQPGYFCPHYKGAFIDNSKPGETT